MDPQPVTDTPITTYFAVQVLPNEDPRTVAGAICQAGHDCKTLFRRLEVLDTVQFANKTFLRCRSDIINPHPMMESLLAQGRGYVVAGPGGQYSVRLPDGRQGAVQGMTMHSAPRPGCRAMYRGPKVKMWDRAFQE